MRIRRRTICVTMVLIVLAVVLARLTWPPVADERHPDQRPDNDGTRAIPLATLATSTFLNSEAGVEYVGSQACRECHQDEWDSYQLSGMARSMHTIDGDRDPAGETFQHEASGRRFQSLWRDKKMVHREELVGEDRPVLLAEHQMSYVVGSGSHFTMYLGEVDGFLVESPLTWYTAKPGWDMSPGYDQPHHLGFQREITTDCLFCHAGQASAIDGSYHRIRITELGISCERCHGPGALHVAQHSSGNAGSTNVDGDHDRTIVNPSRLSRDRADAVCHQCHLQSRAYVAARGRSLADFRPGLALEDFQHYYRSTDPRQQMKVVGHTEQMLLSRCHRESKTLTCLTCHNPHVTLPETERAARHRRTCLTCHDMSACTASTARRQQTRPADNCVTCHMPSVPTNTLHVAVTHHRIGIHRDENAPSAGTPASEDLEPIHDLSRFSRLDRERSLGLAYLKRVFQLGIDSSPESRRLWVRSRELLLQSQNEGLGDPDVDATLAQLLFPTRPVEAIGFARAALENPRLDIESRLNALFALASYHQRQKQPRRALEYLDELIGLRRSAADWELRALCLLQQRDIPATVQALETAIGIDPELLPARDLLARLYRDQGKPGLSDSQRRLVRRLTEQFRKRDPR